MSMLNRLYLTLNRMPIKTGRLYLNIKLLIFIPDLLTATKE
jgi:hypothetical protein